ncbi:MAG: pyruvate kinase alpha/beta domain-containing protein [Dehalococcoidales bacterium]
MEEKIVYFEKAGVINTEETLRLAAERAKARGIKQMVIASTRGDTARLAAERLAGTGIILTVIPHQYSGGREQRFPLELKESLEKQGHHVHFATSLFATENLYGSPVPRVMAFLLRTFSQGMKVCVEMILMAVDGGFVASGEQVIAVAGSGRGADTAVVAIAASSRNLPDLHITEIICKPLQTSQHIPNYVPPEG